MITKLSYPKYIGTKLVEAKPMTAGEFNDSERPGPVSGQLRVTDGYLVVYDDGYRSWSPKDKFDASYRSVEGLSFGLAMEALKMGMRVARSGWNGKGQWVAMIWAGNAMHASAAGSFPMKDCLGLKNAQGDMQPGWVPSQGDLMAEDWTVVVDGK